MSNQAAPCLERIHTRPPAFQKKQGEICCLLLTETSDLYYSKVVRLSFWSPFLLFIRFLALTDSSSRYKMGWMVFVGKKRGIGDRGEPCGTLTSAFFFRFSRFSIALFSGLESVGWFESAFKYSSHPQRETLFPLWLGRQKGHEPP